MKQNNRWRFIIVVLIVVWSLYEIYPPTSRHLIGEFTSRAENQDAAFTNILQRLAPLDKARPDREFANLQDAIGTNSIVKYFPFVIADNELYPTIYILNQIQRDASGKIKLGLDLQGGTSFLVEMDTNRLAEAADNGTNRISVAPDISGALSQAACRRRIKSWVSTSGTVMIAEPRTTGPTSVVPSLSATCHTYCAVGDSGCDEKFGPSPTSTHSGSGRPE